ncbi:MAG: ATP-binding protein [Chloroflexi bacterium]|nr:ATP-binding protein [Chloroflexota bacterium]
MSNESAQSEVKLPLEGLVTILPESLATSVITRALKQFDQSRKKQKAKTVWEEKLGQAIKANIILDGFRPHATDQAPLHRLQPAVKASWVFRHDLTAAVLGVWMEAQSPLVARISAHLDTLDLEVASPPPLERLAFSSFWSWDELNSLTSRYLEGEQEHVDRDEVWLTITLLTGRFPLSDGQQVSEDEDADNSLAKGQVMLWDHWLEELRNVSPDADVWEHVGEFVQAVEAIRAEKAVELERRLAEQEHLASVQRRRQYLEDAIGSFRDTYSSWISYFELEDSQPWAPSACPLDHLDYTAQRLEELSRLIAAYNELDTRPRPQTLAAEKDRRQQKEMLEQSIRELHKDLSYYLLLEGEPQVISATSNGRPEPQPQPSGQPDTAPATVSLPDVLDLESAIPQIETPVAVAAFGMTEEMKAVDTDTVAASVAVTQPVGPLLQPEASDLLEPETGQEQGGLTLPESESESENHEDGFEVPPPPRDVDVTSTALPSPQDTPPEVPRSVPESEEHQEETESVSKADESTASELEPKPCVLDAGRILSSQEAAIVLSGEDSDANWQSLVWALLGESDIAGAYWLTTSLAANKRPIPVEPSLLAALQGARWLSTQSEAFVADFVRLTVDRPQVSHDAHAFLALAAALSPALMFPSADLADWLRPVPCCPTTHELAQIISDFAAFGIALRPEDLLGAAGSELRMSAFNDAAREAKQWLADAPSWRTKLQRASEVWRQLVGVRGELRALLVPVSEDRRVKLSEVRQQLRSWEQQSFAIAQINRLDREKVGATARPIVGNPRDQILRNIDEACRLARRWCELVEHEREVEEGGAWRVEQVSRLRMRVEGLLPKLECALSELRTNGTAAVASSAGCLSVAVRGMCEVLGIGEHSTSPDRGENSYDQWLTNGTNDLHVALLRRLLLLPELALIETGELGPGDLPSVAPALRMTCAENRDWHAALEGWVKQEDYRFVGIMLSAGDEIAAERRLMQEALYGSRAALGKAIADACDAVDQAVVDGIIGEEDRSSYTAKLLGVNVDTVLHFRAWYREIDDSQMRLTERRQARMSELEQEWVDLESRLRSSHIDAATQVRAAEQVSTALSNRDARLVTEYISQISEALDNGADLQLGADGRADDTEAEYLKAQEEFIRLMPSLEEVVSQGLPALIAAARERRDLPGSSGLSFRRMNTSRVDAAIEAMEAWRQLKHGAAWREENPGHIECLLRFLGFSFDALPNPVRVVQKGQYWLHVRVDMSASPILARPIPQFGSQCEKHYDVVCLWERPDVDTISAWLHDLRLDRRSIILLYLGRMSVQRRQILTGSAREHELALAVLDETLLAYLSPQELARLRIFLRCTLPFAAVNPYTPFKSGDVPPEMFFGRERQARELLDSSGTCLVYGGRQLGKSALLSHVQRDFDHPEREQRAWVVDIKLVGDPSAGKLTRSIWPELRDRFKEAGFLPKSIRSEKPEDIARHIRAAILERPERRVLVLFDEADNFLDADASDNFQMVEMLRTLMFDTGRHFKVVFAGLHKVQSFEGIPNHPLAHFGRGLCIGPLEADAAVKLVRQPLEALGYRFSEDTAVVRILSYTNFHPGLIQLFCQELLKHLRERPTNGPLYRIENSDVEAVYRKGEVRRLIQERFDLTLNLDTRYQAIAWSMIDNQMAAHDGYAQAYAPGDVLRLVEGLWPQGVADLGEEGLRLFLDDMCGLGVLRRNAEGHYRLRSPNLVRLMSTETSITDRLLKLTEKQPPTKFQAGSHHALLDASGETYSPLTFEQESSLNFVGLSVGLVFASDALGLVQLPEAVQRLVTGTAEESVIACTEIPTAINSGDRLRLWLDTQLQFRAGQSELVVYQRPGTMTTIGLAGLVQEALRYTESRRSKRPRPRVIFVLDAQSTWTWLSLPENTRRNLEDGVNAVILAKRWNSAGIMQRLRLAKTQKQDSDDVCQAVLNSTGGWPYLLDTLFGRCRKTDDPRPAAKEIESELAIPGSPLRVEFRRALGVKPDIYPRRLVDFMLGLGDADIPTSLLTPELVSGLNAVSEAEVAHSIEFLRRLGLVEVKGDSVWIEPTAARVLV